MSKRKKKFGRYSLLINGEQERKEDRERMATWVFAICIGVAILVLYFIDRGIIQ